MYFDFEDYHPDISPVGQAISWREGVLISIIVHLAAVIFILLFPRIFPDDPNRPRPIVQLAPEKPNTTFVFVQPKLDRRALTAPPEAPPSDMDRQAQSPLRAPKPENPLPFSRGNTPERVESDAQRQQAARGRGPEPDPAIGEQARNQTPDNTTKIPDSSSAM